MTIDEIRALRAVYPTVSAMGNTLYFHDLSQGGGRAEPDSPNSASWVALPGQMDAVQAVVQAPEMIDFLLAELDRLFTSRE